MEPLFKQWFATFQAQHPGVEIEWLDKKGPELPAFYQTQLAAGTPPDIVDIQGGLGLEWAGQGALMDLTPLLEKEPEVRARFNAGISRELGVRRQELPDPLLCLQEPAVLQQADVQGGRHRICAEKPRRHLELREGGLGR